MKSPNAENHPLNFDPAVEWVLPALAIGLACGFVGSLFNFLAGGMYTMLYSIPFPLSAGVPLLAVLAMVRLQERWPEVMGGGVSRTLRYLHTLHKPIPLELTGMKTLASLITLGTGCFAGKEGPAFLMGAGVGHAVGRWFRRRPSVTGLIGAAAMFAALFKTPMGGALFAVEVPYQRFIRQQTFLPAFLAAGIAYFVVISINGSHPLLEIPHAQTVPLSSTDILLFAIMGVVCGLISRAFVSVFHWSFNLSFRWSRKRRLKVGGVIGTALMALLQGLSNINLTGTAVMMSPMRDVFLDASDRAVIPIILVGIAAFVLPCCFESFGFSGGFFAPCIILGASIGSLFSAAFAPHKEVYYLFAGVGGVLAGVMKVPIAAVVLVMEMSGMNNVVPLAVACTVSMMVAGRESVFKDQYAVSHALDDSLPSAG